MTKANSPITTKLLIESMNFVRRLKYATEKGMSDDERARFAAEYASLRARSRAEETLSE